MTSVCDEVGVSRKTAARWLRLCGTVRAHPIQRGRMTWTAEAKLKAIVETAG